MIKIKKFVSLGRLSAVLIGITVALGGCHKVSGGGWIEGVNGGRANLGFQAQCQEGVIDFGFGEESTQDFYEGQFQYRDKGAYVGFHGDINPHESFFGAPVGSCAELVDFAGGFGIPTNTAEFTGTCVSHPGGVEGTFKVEVIDNGKPGPDASDEITVSTPNFRLWPIYDEDWNYLGDEMVAIGVPCTDNGQPYSNSGMLRGGNIAMPHRQNAK